MQHAHFTTARYHTTCPECRQPIMPGQGIRVFPKITEGPRTIHDSCYTRTINIEGAIKRNAFFKRFTAPPLSAVKNNQSSRVQTKILTLIHSH